MNVTKIETVISFRTENKEAYLPTWKKWIAKKLCIPVRRGYLYDCNILVNKDDTNLRLNDIVMIIEIPFSIVEIVNNSIHLRSLAWDEKRLIKSNLIGANVVLMCNTYSMA